MTSPITATVLINGQRVADTGDEFIAGATTVLTDASVKWGRETIVDQPDTSTCTCTIARRAPGAAGFLGGLRVGARLDLTTSGTSYPDPTVSTFLDPGFTTGVGGRAPSNAVPVWVPPSASTLLRTNHVANPSYEVDVAGWSSSGGGVLTRDTTEHHGAGAASLKVVTTTAADSGMSMPAAPITVVTGAAYSLSAWVKAPAGAQMKVVWRLQSPVSDVVVNFDGTGAWQRVTSPNRIAAAGVTAYIVSIRTRATHAAPVTYWVDEVMIENGAAVGTYFDGETLDTPTADYAWSGTPNNSTSTEHATDGGRLDVTPANAARAASVVLAPAAFVPHTASPDAWDGIPATSTGQRWGYGIDVMAPAGAVVTVRPVLFAGPWSDGWAVAPDAEALVVVGDGSWVTVSGEFLPNADGRWVGVQVTANPTGYRWVDLDPALTWLDLPGDVRWVDYVLVRLDNVRVLAPAGGVQRTALVFSGRITDLSASFDGGMPGGGGVRVDVTAQDFTADLANVRIGDEPWLVERLDTRINRILALSGSVVTAQIDGTLAPTLVTYRDVDSQAAAGLITELAQSVDGVLWSATHATTGPFYWLEDPARRPALERLALIGGVVVIVPDPAVANALRLSSCDALRDPVEWAQDVSDVSTRADVSWLEQGVDGQGKPTTTDRHVVVIDAPLEASVGQRGVTLSTQLQARLDAEKVAGRLLSRITASGWRLDGLVWDTSLMPLDVEDIETALDLLDGTTRIGRALILTDLPSWAPSGPDLPLYIEGGEWTFSGGWWVFNLATSSSAGGQGISVRWQDVPAAWSWAMFSPGIAWDDLRGVAGPVTGLTAPIREDVPA